MPVRIVAGSDAVQNLASQPANLILYGPPGTQKTTDAVAAFTKDGRCSAFVIPCEDGALLPILARGMPVPDHTERPVKSWAEMQEVMNWLGQNRGRYSAVIIDTLSTFTMYLYREVEAGMKGSRNKFDIPIMMRNCLFQIREWTRLIGLNTVFICHAMEPTQKEGVMHRGGPLLAPKSMIEQYYGLIDSVLRVSHIDVPGEGSYRVYWTGGESWPSAIPASCCPPDYRLWRVKNREGCGDAVVPADLGNFLRSRTPPYPGM